MYKNQLGTHVLIKVSTEKFNILFNDVQKQKEAVIDEKKLEELFLLEVELINTFFQTLTNDIKTIISVDPNFIVFATTQEEMKQNELLELARTHLIEVLNSYEKVDISRILIIAKLS